MKEEMLRTYLADELFVEKGYLRAGEAEKYQWADRRVNPLVDVLKLAIEGDYASESQIITGRKINQKFITTT
jgi:hypothetical protein